MARLPTRPPGAGAVRRPHGCVASLAIAACATVATWSALSWDEPSAFAQPLPEAGALGGGAALGLTARAQAGAAAAPRDVARRSIPEGLPTVWNKRSWQRIEGINEDPDLPVPPAPKNTPKYIYKPLHTTAPVEEPPPDWWSENIRPYAPSAAHLEYAVIEYASHQYMVTEGAMYEGSFIRAIPGSKVRLNRVLLLKQKNTAGEFEVSVGQPIVHGAYAEITILEHLKSEEQLVWKHKAKKHYMRRWWTFQKLTRFRLDKIVWEKDEVDRWDKEDAAFPAGRPAYPMGWNAENKIGSPPLKDGSPRKPYVEKDYTKKFPL